MLNVFLSGTKKYTQEVEGDNKIFFVFKEKKLLQYKFQIKNYFYSC